MVGIYVLDDNYLALTILVTFAMQMSFFAIAAFFVFDKVTDIAGAANFVLLAWLTFGLRGTYYDRQIIDTTLVSIWGIRLGAFLLYRILKRGKDERFDHIRESFFQFLGFWIYQIVWVWLVSLALIFLNASKVDVDLEIRDYIGWALWGIGFLIESIADQSKSNFLANPDNRGKFLSSGVWHYSRHPNYFGEIILWLGIFLSCSVAFDHPGNTKYGYFGVISPVLTFYLLVFVSGIPAAEDRYDLKFGKDPMYLEYKKSTSPLIPLPPCLYRAFSNTFKRVFCCEFLMFSRNLAPEASSLLKNEYQ